MIFAQKLKTLRKEHNYSQEELAQILDVSRQAVSKWESDRGIPETDKLMQISTIFGVTLDYLLKTDCLENDQQTNGYYVSRKMIDDFLSYKRQGAKRISIGISLIVLSNMFSSIYNQEKFMILLYWISISLGIAVLIWNFFQPKRYEEIGTKQLLFDDDILRQFRLTHDKNRKRYMLMIITAAIIVVLGPQVISVAFGYSKGNISLVLSWILHAIWLSLAILAGISLHAEGIIAQNAKYMQKRNKNKYAWIYIALPVTALFVVIGIFTNAWNPLVPIIILFSALLVTICKLLMEGRNSK